MARIVPRNFIRAALSTISGAGGVAPPSSEGVTLFSEDFTNYNGGLFGFAQNVTTGGATITHLPTGGRGGTPCVLLAPNKSNTQQHQVGWYTGPLNHTFHPHLDTIYIRFRIKFAAGYRWNSAGRVKLIQIGQSGASVPTGTLPSRVIVYLDRPGADNKVGTLGARNYVPPHTYGDGGFFPYGRPSHFGLPFSNDWSTAGGVYGSFRAVANIGNNAGGPILVTGADNPSPPAPGPNSVAPVEHWYDAQLRIITGAVPNCRYTLWVNNNNFASPTYDQTWWPNTGLGEDAGLSTFDWSHGLMLAPYIDEPPQINQDIYFGGFEVGTAFRANWSRL